MATDFPYDHILEQIQLARLRVDLYPRLDYGAEILLLGDVGPAPVPGVSSPSSQAPVGRLKFAAFSERSLDLIRRLQESLEQDVQENFTRKVGDPLTSDGRNATLSPESALGGDDDDDTYGFSTDFS